ncbi:MAG: hypothetical protein AYL28_006360, partial [Candidatus Bathyarchaeota archaeon B23]
FKALSDSLGWLAKYIGCSGCERGGGPPDCAIRLCAKERGYELCSQCSDLEGCTKFDWFGEFGVRLKERLRRGRGRTKRELIEEALQVREK